MSVAKEFREFVLRGNVVDLAVGVVIGAAFATVVKAFTEDIITPIIGIAGKQAFSTYKIPLRGTNALLVGDLLNQIITFLITAFVIFFFVVKPVNWLMARRKTETPADATTRDCPYCLSSIPIAATRCAFCTSEVAKA
ncbi:MAG: large conductance mechanosensitive channel protein MscL [Capsulimonas sp.]|uniref:large conductance mechanosensitive channel protein MscL n=1 Tax=Capsulimonas sp. TaxID=2494211 RepID=UPI003264C502